MSKPGETDYGKGSFPRIWNSEVFRDNFDAIDWQSSPETMWQRSEVYEIFQVCRVERRGDYLVAFNKQETMGHLLHIPTQTHMVVAGGSDFDLLNRHINRQISEHNNQQNQKVVPLEHENKHDSSDGGVLRRKD